MVKKILRDGSPCRKCGEVESRLAGAGLLDRIDKTVIADERDPDSEGMRLAARHGVTMAPFFIVMDDQGNEQIYTVFFRFLKDVLQSRTTETDEVSEIMDSNPDLDYL